MFRLRNQSNSVKLGWRLLIVSGVFAIPVIVWWPIDLTSCGWQTQVDVSESMGAYLLMMFLYASPVLILFIPWLYISSLVLMVKVYRSGGKQARNEVLLAAAAICIYYVLRAYFERICASNYGLGGMIIMILFLSFISVRLMTARSPSDSATENGLLGALTDTDTKEGKGD